MTTQICFISLLLLYWISEAITETSVWRHVSGVQLLNPGNYHLFRLLQIVGIAGSIVMAYLCRLMPYNLFAVLLIGSWLAGWTIYEAIFTLRNGAPLWVKLSKYKLNLILWQIELIIPRWIYIVAFTTGVVLIAVGIICL